MSSPFKLIAVLIAAGFCVPAAFAADAVTSASVVPAAQKTQDGAVLEGTKTLAAKGGVPSIAIFPLYITHTRLANCATSSI